MITGLKGCLQLYVASRGRLPGTVDGHVKSIARTYDSYDRVTAVTSYANADGTGTIRNQISYAYYAAWSKISVAYQSHEGAVGGGTPKVEYVFDGTDTSNVYNDGVRLTTTEYPSGHSLLQVFDGPGTSTAIGDRLHRAQKLAYYPPGSGGTDLVQYAYNGTGRLVTSDYLVPDVKLDLYQGTAGTYAGYDRFGRPVDHQWVDYGGMTVVNVDRIKYGYDYAGNRTWREDTVAAANSKNHDELYTYDALQRLKDTQRGKLLPLWRAPRY